MFMDTNTAFPVEPEGFYPSEEPPYQAGGHEQARAGAQAQAGQDRKPRQWE